jgi:predicted nucleic acid-binding protein
VGLAEQLCGVKICLDTAPFIYFVERNKDYLKTVKSVFAEIDAGKIEAITSTITLLEVLVHPLRKKNVILAEKYREILLYSEGVTTFEILNEISEIASELRAKYSIRTPDALQIGTGIFHGADKFLTNDVNLKKVNEIEVIVLDDFI